MFVEKIYEYYSRKINATPCHANRASSLGDPCERRLVYDQTEWNKKLLHEVDTQLIFEEGNNQEQVVIRDLMLAGIQVREQQRAFSFKDLNITGHQDVEVRTPEDDRWYPAEIKSMSPHIYDKIRKLQDFFELTSYPWLQKYPAQLQLYMLASEGEADRGLFILKNKSTGALKEIWADIDIVFLDELFKKAGRINKYVAENTLPDRTEDLSHCKRCHYRHICLPDEHMGRGMEVNDILELEMILERLDELTDPKTEYDALWKKLNVLIKKKQYDSQVVRDMKKGVGGNKTHKEQQTLTMKI